MNKDLGRREARLGADAPRRPVCDRPGLQGVMLAVWRHSSANCHRMSQRIEGRLRPKSVRRVGPARLTRRCRARAGVRTARPDGERPECRMPEQMKMANAFCGYLEMAERMSEPGADSNAAEAL
jgi:hypothetical protein